MSSIKGKTVYSVLYNYGDSDYSLIKIMEKLEDAFDYICLQENTIYNIDDYNKLFKLINVKKEEDIKKYYLEDHIVICNMVAGNYNHNVSSYIGVSNYIIVPHVIA